MTELFGSNLDGSSVILWSPKNYPLSEYQQITFSDELQSDMVNDLISYPLQDRLNVYSYFVKYSQLQQTIGSVLRTKSLPMPNCDQKDLATVIDTLLETGITKKISAKSFFLMVDLVHRCLPIVLPTPESRLSNNLLLFSYCCFMLVQMATNEISSRLTYSYFKNSTQKTETEVTIMLISIIIVVRGIISAQTPWDFVSNSEDLVTAFPSILSCEYYPEKVQQTDGKNDKNVLLLVLFGALRKTYDLEYDSNYKKLQNLAKSSTVSTVNPVILPSVAEKTFDKPRLNFTKIIDLLEDYNSSKEKQKNLDESYIVANYIITRLPLILEEQEHHVMELQTLLELLEQTALGQRISDYFYQ
jgi:hypothetical protein